MKTTILALLMTLACLISPMATSAATSPMEAPPVVGVMIGHWSGSEYPLGVAFLGDGTFRAEEMEESDREWKGNWKIDKGWNIRMAGPRFTIHGFRVDNRVYAKIQCAGQVGFGCFIVTYDGC